MRRQSMLTARLIVLAAAALMLPALVSCTGSDNPLDQEPGDYKGVTDPLTERSADERARVLAERFKLVQDRQ